MRWRERWGHWINRESAELVLELTRWSLAFAVALVVNIDAVGNAAMRFRPERLRLTKGGKLVIVRQ
jgi:SpoU rRNA methylase family enzyme